MKRKKITQRGAGSRKSLQGTEIELDIESLSNTGDGVGRINSRVVFVPSTMPGDRVCVSVHTDKRTFLLAVLVEILQPSTDRIEAPCRFFGVCGGCDWQHIPYELQLKTKATQLADTLKRIGGIADAKLLPVQPSSAPYHYRNRIQGQVERGKFFQHRKNSKETVCVDLCLIADQRINDAIKDGLSMVPDGKVELAVVDEKVQILPLKDRATRLGFRQINTAVSGYLDELLLKIISQSQCENVFDFYCGRGGWTNRIAKTYPHMKVTGVDSIDVNIEAATATAKSLGLGNVSFLQARVEDSLSVLAQKNSLGIVDPPRSGLDSLVTRALCKKRTADLIYISCHPATLARDLKVLTEKAYSIKSVQPLDMFPQTAHLECLVHLQSGSAKS